MLDVIPYDEQYDLDTSILCNECKVTSSLSDLITEQIEKYGYRCTNIESDGYRYEITFGK